ncbi:putative lipoprotein (DUF940) [gamma proteobacterium HIMB55]|nr:putative lipoprotein (DUF940) [gamma proteobacterium HIMB55]
MGLLKHPKRNHKCLVPLAVVSMSWLCSSALASDYGTTGLIDIPTARMQPDGTLTATAAFDGRHRQFALSYQIAPWLEGTFRYTGFDEFSYWDRNYEVKAQLWDENLFLPAVAFGIRDAVGTGVFGSEYLVATKGIGQLDVSLGVGWGRLAGNGDLTNPARLLSDRFDQRRTSQIFGVDGTGDRGNGGEVSFGDFFSGPEIGLFGGLQYVLPEYPLTVLVEYNPDRYAFDRRNGSSLPSSSISYGIKWTAFPGVEIAASHQHGDEVGLAIEFSLDSLSDPIRPTDRDFISSYYLPQNKLPPQIQKERWYSRLLYDVERSGLLLVEGTLSQDQQQAQLVVGNASLALWSDAIGDLTAMADLHLPPSVRTIFFVVEDGGHRTATIVVPRPSSSYKADAATHLSRIRVLSGRTLEDPQHRTSFVTGKLNTELNLKSRFQLFDPDDPARYQVYADLFAEYSLSSHWAIRASLALNLENNFDESLRQKSDSVLPKVRSDIVKYLNQGESGLEKLIVEGRNTYGRSIHYRAFAGVLEEMFSGVGGEVLYWPSKSRLAFGASIAYAKQRDFDRSLKHLDYDVMTGHLSAYWATPFYNYDVAVHVGRYLAKDTGATLEVRRTFRNGWQVGVWATLTDVPFEDFGEGSFDKGMYFQLPLDTIFGGATRSKLGTRIRPIQRDGGQRLEGYSGNIFWDLREARYDAFQIDERLLP